MRVSLTGRVAAVVAVLVSGAAGACSSTQSGAGGAQAGASGASSAAGGALAVSGGSATDAGAPGAAGSVPTSGSGGTVGSGGSSVGGSATGSAGSPGAGAAGNVGGAGFGGGGAGVGGSSGGGVAGHGGASGAAGSSGSAGTGGAALPNITVWIAGDSTVATGGPCPIGWGGQIKNLFDTRVTVTNSAVAGRSVRTWLYDVLDTMDGTGECNLGKDSKGNPTVQDHWTAMLNGMKAGDYLLIQFGINDSDPTCPRHVGSAAFQTSYGVMAQAAKDRGAHPVFITPVSNIACTGSTVNTNTRQPFVTATKDAGTQYAVPVIDLNALSTALYKTLGFCPIPGGDVSATTAGPVGTFFCDDHTHFDQTGAVQIAGLVAKGLSAGNIGLAAYLK